MLYLEGLFLLPYKHITLGSLWVGVYDRGIKVDGYFIVVILWYLYPLPEPKLAAVCIFLPMSYTYLT